MLSPKAPNRVNVSVGGGATRTPNEQVSVRWRASVAVQVTVVDPTGNDAPLSGAHVAVTGGAPSATKGAEYVTVTGFPKGETVEMGAGHVIFGGLGTTGGGGGGALGAVVPEPQATTPRPRATAKAATNKMGPLLTLRGDKDIRTASSPRGVRANGSPRSERTKPDQKPNEPESLAGRFTSTTFERSLTDVGLRLPRASPADTKNPICSPACG
jgi:hypothetical protein